VLLQSFARMDSFLICATPRTGSSLLCGLLASTEVAGRPESYFRQPDEPAWASQWGIARADGTFAYADYVERALAAGRTRNGVFASAGIEAYSVTWTSNFRSAVRFRYAIGVRLTGSAPNGSSAIGQQRTHDRRVARRGSARFTGSTAS
jgi:LPS sulfotransferase NodH